jgi:hypothetical protein
MMFKRLRLPHEPLEYKVNIRMLLLILLTKNLNKVLMGVTLFLRTLRTLKLVIQLPKDQK